MTYATCAVTGTPIPCVIPTPGRMMTDRIMYDATHQNVPQLPRDGQIYAGYDTGSLTIVWTPDDWASLPKGVAKVAIDQGFTGSPNLAATVRDCENGAWNLAQAASRTGWNVPRPTLYLGFPDTARQAYDAGWRGDVWLVMPSDSPPVSPPAVPPGLHVVAVQWQFAGPWDGSVVFDAAWPLREAPMSGYGPLVPAELHELSLGTGGRAVQVLQQLLGLWGPLGHILVSGTFDEATKAAVVAWQQAHGLSADGVCGPLTWESILGTLH